MKQIYGCIIKNIQILDMKFYNVMNNNFNI